MAVTTTTALILGGAALGGVSGAMGIKQANSSIDVLNENAYNTSQERIRQAEELRSRQAVSFLKSGVLLSGTPELVMNETADYANRDVRQVFKQRDIQAKNLRSSAYTNMFTSIIKGGLQGAGLAHSMGGFTPSASGAFGTKISSGGYLGTLGGLA